MFSNINRDIPKHHYFAALFAYALLVPISVISLVFLFLIHPNWSSATGLAILLPNLGAVALFVFGIYRLFQGNIRDSLYIFIGAATLSILLHPLVYNNFGIIWAVIMAPIFWIIVFLSLPNESRLTAGFTATIFSSLPVGIDLFTVTDTALHNLIQDRSGIILLSYVLSLIVIILLISLYGYQHFNLRLKFVVATGLLAVSGVLATTVAVTQTISRILTAEVQDDLQSTSQFRAETLATILSQTVQSHEALQTNQAIHIAVIQQNKIYTELTRAERAVRQTEDEANWLNVRDREEWPTFLNLDTAVDIRVFQNAFPKHRNIIITDQYGSIVAASKPPESFTQAGNLWWQGAFKGGQGQIYVGNPIVSEANNTIHVPIATPIFDGFDTSASEPIGIIYTEFDLTESLLFITSNVGNTNEQFVSLVVNNFVAEVNQGELDFYLIPMTTSDAVALFSSGFTEANYSGKAHLLSFDGIELQGGRLPINNLNWGILASQTVESSQAAVVSQQQTQILIGFIIVVIGITLAILVSRLVSDPIMRLADVANQFASGKLDVRAPIETGDEIATLANTFNQMATNTKENIELLETRVSERTEALSISFRISQKLSTILNRQTLANEIVTQLQETFDFYHVHVYLLQQEQSVLNMVSGSGEAGRKLLDHKHQIPVGSGLVGTAAQQNRSIFERNVRLNKNWLPNRFLPATQTEIAVPISIDEHVIGVIDVQESQVGRLDEQMEQLLKAIAAQTAVAFRNAQFFEDAQHRANRESMINEIRDKIQRTHDVESALKTAVRELGVALRSDQTAVKLSSTNNTKKRKNKLSA